MKWLIAQTWLLLLLSFLAGAALTWLFFVRPRQKKVTVTEHPIPAESPAVDHPAGDAPAAPSPGVMNAKVDAATPSPAVAPAAVANAELDEVPNPSPAAASPVAAVDGDPTDPQADPDAALSAEAADLDTPAIGFTAPALLDSEAQFAGNSDDTVVINGDVAAGAPYAGSARPRPDGSAPSPDFAIKGVADSMIYHGPASPSYRQAVAEVWFRTEADAENAGFRPWDWRTRTPTPAQLDVEDVAVDRSSAQDAQETPAAEPATTGVATAFARPDLNLTDARNGATNPTDETIAGSNGHPSAEGADATKTPGAANGEAERPAVEWPTVESTDTPAAARQPEPDAADHSAPHSALQGLAASLAAENSPYGPGSALAAVDGSTPSEEYRIKGNADSMLYHTTNSPYFTRTRANVWFRTPEDAEAAGFTAWNKRRQARLTAVPTFEEGPYPGSAKPHKGGAAPSEEFTVKGNEDSMLYHTMDSPLFGATKAEVWFRSEADAQRAGFVAWRTKTSAR